MGIGTQLLLKQRIALELARPDIPYTDQRIADAITDAITMYQKHKFRFSEINPASPPTFTTNQGQFVYSVNDSNADAGISNVMCINWLAYNQGTSTFYIRRVSPLEIIMANQGSATWGQVNWGNFNYGGAVQGPPEMFAYEGESIMLSPLPDQAYTVMVDAHQLVPAPTSDTQTGNRWMTDGELLIRSRVKFEIATHVTRNPIMAAQMSPDPPLPGQPLGATYRAWRALKGEANRLQSKGRVRAMPW